MEIEGYENYLIYEDGRCLSTSRKKNHHANVFSAEMFLKPRLRKDYYSYMLYKNGYGKAFSVHRLVALHYIPNPNNFRVVNHIDCNGLNNHKDNLEWTSDIYNGQSFNKKKTNIGTITTRVGVRKTTYRGQIKIYGKMYYTKSFDNKEIVQIELDKIVETQRRYD